MKVVFADTGYWLAALNPKDDWNEKATSASRALGKARFITSEMVLDELLAALSKLPVRPMAIEGVKAIRRDPNIEVVPQTPCNSAKHLTCIAKWLTRNGASQIALRLH